MTQPTRPSWVQDTSLCFRIKDSVETMLRGRHDFNRRMKIVMGRLHSLRPSNFPEELQLASEILLAADQLAIVRFPGAPNVFAYSRMTPLQRDLWFEALLTIYKAIVIDRNILGRPI